mgnify:CR=1 FL=1
MLEKVTSPPFHVQMSNLINLERRVRSAELDVINVIEGNRTTVTSNNRVVVIGNRI